MAFKYRGPNTFFFARKRFWFGLKSMMAEHRTCNPGGGGSWNAKTGDGHAWHKNSERFGCWSRVRTIKGGQWVGPWRHQRWE